MLIFLYLLALLFLFAVLSLAADLVVKNIKYIASVLQVRLFVFGVVLGLVTNLPELSVGINAILDQSADLSVGNILGGIIVILSLILGINLLLNRKIKTDGDLKIVVPIAVVIFFPILLGLDGHYGVFDGLLMIGLYLCLLFYLYRSNHYAEPFSIGIINREKITQASLLSILGMSIVLLSSHWIVKTTLVLLDYFDIQKFVAGVLVYAIGTNLPEISVVFSSWRKKASELSLSHLLSSAFSHVFILGIIAFLSPIRFNVGPTYWLISFFTALILILFLIFYKSGKRMDRKEGFVLVSVYALFLVLNLFFIIKDW